MKKVLILTKRELMMYFTTPVGYVFLISFLLLHGFLVYHMMKFFEGQIMDIPRYFSTFLYVFLIFVPAVSMRLWSEERRTGTIELLLTLPVTTPQAVISKFLASWIFLCTAILGSGVTFVPTILELGDPDLGVLVSNYFATCLIAGAFLSIGSLASALTKNQINSLILSIVISLFFLITGITAVLELLSWFPALIDFLMLISFFEHYDSIVKGILDSRDILFFVSFIVIAIYTNIVVIDHVKAK